MPGGLMQIISYGPQDLSLTGCPEITFFNIVYRRYTNFGTKIISISFDNTPDFGSSAFVNIPKNTGDLLSKLILRIKLPRIDLSSLSDLYDLTKNNISATYYDYFITFINKLKNIINIFFLKYDLITSKTAYIDELKKNILLYINNNEYYQFFTVIDYFFNASTQINKFNTNTFKNASLFMLNNDILTYIYDKLDILQVSYDEFKFLIKKNVEILDNLNDIIYTKLNDTIFNQPKIKFCWVNKIAIYLFNSIDFYVGSNKIYSLSDYYINNYSELYYKNKDLYNKLIGNNIEINMFKTTHEETYLYLPVPFWQLSNYGLAFPLIALQYNSIQIKINIKKLTECIKVDIGDISNMNNGNNDGKVMNIKNNISDMILNNYIKNIEITLLTELIYLDRIERKKFAQSAHEYLIEQVQEFIFDNVNPTNNSFQIDAFHCCKDMFWFAQKKIIHSDIFSNNPNVFEYYYNFDKPKLSNNDLGLIEYVKILYLPHIAFDLNNFLYGLSVINNNVLLIKQFNLISNYYSNSFVYPSQNLSLNSIILESYFNLNSVQLIGQTNNFFNYVQVYNYYNSTPQYGLNTYSFCLKPTEFQPSGSCNMSKISFFGLKLRINTGINDDFYSLFSQTQQSFSEYKLVFQIRNFNILRLIGGICATAYTY